MSSNKRRKLDAPGASQPTVSAISAIAARRRLAAQAAKEDPSLSPEPDESPSSKNNSFSILQSLKGHAESPKLPKNPGLERGRIRKETRLAESPVSILDPEALVQEVVGQSPQLVAYSSFSLTKANCRATSSGLALRLKDAERFIVLGSFGIRVNTGEVTIYGATLRPSNIIHWVHAPQCHAVPVIRTSEKASLELHNDSNTENLRKLSCLSPLFKNLWNEPLEAEDDKKPGVGKTFQIIRDSNDNSKRCNFEELVSPPAWNKRLASIVASAADKGIYTTMICGPKSAGKSTFSKLLANRILTSDKSSSTRTLYGVAMLDLDPGQPEFAPCGTLSLVHLTKPNLSASFTHPSLDDPSYKVVRCHALASITPASAPEHYLACVLDLLDTYRRMLRNCNLLINTPGWILGTGQDLLVKIITRLNPDEVVYMSEDGPADVVDILRRATKRAFSILPSQPAEFASRTAAHLRAMQTMSYFHLSGDISKATSQEVSWDSSPLSDICPWTVLYEGPQRGVSAVLSYDYQPPSELLAENINGMILAAVAIEGPDAFSQFIETGPSEGSPTEDVDQRATSNLLDKLICTTAEGLPFIPNPNDMTLNSRYSRAIGLVLIRGIDTKTKCLQLITPISPKTIQEIKLQGRQIVFVHGKFDAPTWAYTEHLYASSHREQSKGKAIDTADDEKLPNGDESEGSEDLEDTEDQETDEDEEVGQERGAKYHIEAESTAANAGSISTVPWVEVLRGNQKRPVGSRVWRVRRDLGRHNNT